MKVIIKDFLNWLGFVSVLSVLVLVLFVACPKIPAPNPAPVQVKLADDTLRVNLGEVFEIENVILDGQNVYAVNEFIRYDSTFLKIETVAGKPVFESGGYLGANADLSMHLPQGRQGSLIVAYTKVGTQPGTNGSGRLWKASFKAYKPGVATISFDLAQSALLSPDVIDGQQERLQAQFLDGVVKSTGTVTTKLVIKIAEPVVRVAGVPVRRDSKVILKVETVGIVFTTRDKDFIDKAKVYGNLYSTTDKDEYQLFVDTRYYNFKEVADYLQTEANKLNQEVGQ